MSSELLEQLNNKFNDLPLEQKQQALTFIDRLHTETFGITDLSTNKAHMKDFGRDSMGAGWKSPEEREAERTEPVSFAEAARDYIGCLDGGPEDLSSNKAYLEGLGEV